MGLFGRIVANASISNLAVTNVDITTTGTSGEFYGAVVAYVNTTNTTNPISIKNVYSTGSISGPQSFGSYPYMGGIAGQVNSGSIENVYSTCSLSNGYIIGGIVGFNNGNVVNVFYAGSAIVSSTSWMNLIAGYNSGTITYSHSVTVSGVGPINTGTGNTTELIGAFSTSGTNYASNTFFSSSSSWDFTNAWQSGNQNNSYLPLLIPHPLSITSISAPTITSIDSVSGSDQFMVEQS